MMSLVIFALWPNIEDCLFLLIITCQNFPLIWCIVMFGALTISVPCLDTDIFSLLLMIAQDLLGFIFLKKNLMFAVAVPQFFNMISNQFNSTIKVFRSDHAKELSFTDFFNQKGVLHQYSCVETPQQVERKHQHLLNVAIALFFQSRIPIGFWTNCISTAAFLINHTPSPLLGNKSPFELLYKQSLDYSCLRVFGCLAFASTLSNHRTKFQPRARICVFLGYLQGSSTN